MPICGCGLWSAEFLEPCAGSVFDSDVLVPQGRLGGDEIRHHLRRTRRCPGRPRRPHGFAAGPPHRRKFGSHRRSPAGSCTAGSHPCTCRTVKVWSPSSISRRQWQASGPHSPDNRFRRAGSHYPIAPACSSRSRAHHHRRRVRRRSGYRLRTIPAWRPGQLRPGTARRAMEQPRLDLRWMGGPGRAEVIAGPPRGGHPLIGSCCVGEPSGKVRLSFSTDPAEPDSQEHA